MTDATHNSRPLQRQLVLAALAFAIFFPCGMLLHEGGHWIAAKFFGWDTHFAYSRTSFTASDLTTRSYFVFIAAGPLVDVAFVATGLLYLYWTRHSGKKRTLRAAFWFASALVFSAMRWLKAPFQEGADESRISDLLEMPWQVVPWILFLPACLVFACLVWTHYRERTLVPLGIGFGAGMLSFLSWYFLVGPQLLPKLT